MKKLALALLPLVLPAPASAHLEFDLFTPDGDLYPGCEVEPESRPADCPYRLKIHGWDVYVSSLILADEITDDLFPESAFERINTFINNLDWQFRLLGGLEYVGFPVEILLPRYFAAILQDKGVSIYIYPRIYSPDGRSIPHSDDKYVRCRTACYLGVTTCTSSTGLPCEDYKPRPGQVQMPIQDAKLTISLLVHELAHAWHDNVVPGGFDNQCIIDAYNFSVDRDQLYSNYLLRSEPFGFLDEVMEREVGSSYATVNHKEYFAVLTTFYFLDDAFPLSSVPYSNRVEMHDLDWNGYWMIRILVEQAGRNNPLSGVSNDCGAVVTTFDENGNVIRGPLSFWPK